MNNKEFIIFNVNLVNSITEAGKWNLETVLVKIERQRILNSRKEKLKKLINYENNS